MSTNIQFDGTIEISCISSEVETEAVSAPKVKLAGSTTGEVLRWTFTGCSRTLHVLARGHLALQSSGTILSDGARFTVQTTILGFPVHCIYFTSNTDVGTLTEGTTPAEWHVGQRPIPEEATSSLCGDDAELTGTYEVKTPGTAITVDP